MSQLPENPWQCASADFYGPMPAGELLLVMDTYNRYPEVEIVKSTSATETIPMFETLFATHGIPSELKTDNGPPFQSEFLRRSQKKRI